MVDVAPEPRAGNQELGDLTATVVEDQRIPVRMESKSRIGMLIQACAIEHCQAMNVGWKMSRHPVNQDTNASLVHVIHEVLEVMW